MNNAFICFVGFILRFIDFISNTSGLIESFWVNRKKGGPVFLQCLKVLPLAKRWSHLLSTVTLGSNFVPGGVFSAANTTICSTDVSDWTTPMMRPVLLHV